MPANKEVPDHDDDLHHDDEDASHVPDAREIAVGGGPSQITNVVMLGVFLLGIIYALVTFLTAK